MRIDDYYRSIARISMNESIAALVPAILIIVSNIFIFHHKELMLLAAPFFIYSLVSFQIYLKKVKYAIEIERNLMNTKRLYHSLFEVNNFVVLFINTFSSRLMIFSPDGYLAAVIKKCRKKEQGAMWNKRTYCLYNSNEEVIANYTVKGKKQIMIEVYDQSYCYIGCYERKKKDKKELLDAEGRFIGAVEGAALYMDEQISDPYNRLNVRLRRGWMPLEWSSRFPDPNMPVLSLSNRLTEKDKVLQMAFLINEFFLER